MEYFTLNERFARQAADLVISNYRSVCAGNRAFMADAFTSPVLAGDLLEWAGKGGSVVAHENGELQGFVAGRFIEFYQSKKTFYSPEWAHGVAGPVPDRVLNGMYAWLTRSGQVDDSAVHIFGVYASEVAMKTAIANLEFGVHMMDGVLSFPPQPIPRELPAGVTIRAAESGDIPAIIDLDRQLWTHLAQPPVSLPLDLANYPENRSKYVIPREGSYISVAEIDRVIVGFVSCRLGLQETRGLRNEAVPGINGAFVDIDHRDNDVGQAMLDDIFRWAKELKAPFVMVDFETTNVEGSGFWRSREFEPVAFGMTRRLPG